MWTVTPHYQGLAMQNRLGWTRWLPGLLTLRQYQAGWLPNDIVAGLVLSTMLVPVGMAYAVAKYRRGKTADAFLAHATTNAGIAAYVLVTGTWSLWD